MDTCEQARRDISSNEAEIDKTQDISKLPHRFLDEINIDYLRALQAHHEASFYYRDEYQVTKGASKHPQQETIVEDKSLHENEHGRLFVNNRHNASAHHVEVYAPIIEILGGFDELEEMIKSIQELIEKQSLAIKEQKLGTELRHEMPLELQQTLKNLQSLTELMSRAYKILKDTKENTATLFLRRSQTAEPAFIGRWPRPSVTSIWYATNRLFKRRLLLFLTILVVPSAFSALLSSWPLNFSFLKPDLTASASGNNRLNEFYNRQADTPGISQEEMEGYEAVITRLSEALDTAPLPSSFGSFSDLMLGAAIIAVFHNLGAIITGSRRAIRG